MSTAYNEAIPYNSVLGYDGTQPVVTAAQLPTWSMEVENPFTGVKTPLPEASIDSMSFESSAPSAISFTCANTSVGANALGDLMIVNLKANGVQVRDGRWILRGQNWNAGRKAQIKSWSGRSLLWDRLGFTVIQPGVRKLFSAKTPGYILNELFNDAKARSVGFWSSFTWTFTATKDSNGKAWPTALGSMEYLPSAIYADIVGNLVDKGVIEISLQGNEIRATVPDTDGAQTNTLLVVGEDVTDAPQQSSADNLVSDVVVLGDDGVAIVRSNTETRAKYWREEAGISQGGTKDIGTLSVFGDVALSTGDAPRIQRTYELVVTQNRPFLPLRDYVVGDWVRTQHGDDTPAASFRVKQIALKSEKGRWTGSLVLNDKFLENELRLTKKVQGIIGGATITGSAQTSTPDSDKDTTTPNPPSGVTGSSTAYVDSNGALKAQAIFSWSPPTTNTDGSVADDIDHYRVAYKYSEDSVWRWEDTDQTTWFISPLDPNRDLLFYVRAIDQTGHWSGNQPSPYVLNTGTDTTPPPTPSGPLLTSLLRTAVIEWDGLTASGAQMPSDLNRVEVYVSKVNDFDVYLDGDLRGTLQPGGSGQLTTAMYGYVTGQTYYAKFVAIDNSGNRSPASAQNFGTVAGVVGSDIVANSITANQLAVGSVTAQAIEAGAITADKISLGQTVNLVQDPSFNNPDWRAKRRTSAWAENSAMWFFALGGGIERNGYYLQALSRPDGQNGGRLYVTDYIYTQVGESYFFGMYMRTGQFTPNPEATMRMGLEVVKSDGTVLTDGISYLPSATWTKYGYRFTIIDPSWVKLRYYVRADNITAGDIAIDDLEVRGGVGTTEYTGSRGLIDPQGLEAYDANNNQTVLIDFRTGNFTAQGTIQSGFTGKRIVINPSSTFLPEVRFYPQIGTQFAYINASDNLTTDFPFIGVNAPDNSGTGISNAMILYDTNSLIGAVRKSTGEVQSGISVIGMTKQTSEVAIYGRLTYSSEAHRLFSGGQFNAGGAPTPLPNAGTIAAVIGKPAAPPSNCRWMLTFTCQRAAADKFFAIATQDTATSTTIGCYPDTNWVTATNPTMFINFVFWRTDL